MRPGTREALREGARLFDAGAYWEAHEVWEAAWRSEEGEPRQLLHGLILAAAGWVQRGREREAGARTLFTRALGRLQGVSAHACGVDVGQLRGELETWREGRQPGPPRLRCDPPHC